MDLLKQILDAIVSSLTIITLVDKIRKNRNKKDR